MIDEIYNKDYFDNYGHTNDIYSESVAVQKTLDNLAEFLVQNCSFNTHLDVGCAMGHLVSSMVKRGKNSWGIDGSTYAIQNAVEGLQGRLSVQDAIFPIQTKYDLVTCVETVEHIDERHTDRVIRNLCNASSKYIFFSSDYNMQEVTHINVRTRSVWLGYFLMRDFKYVPVTCPDIYWGFLLERI